MIPKQTLKALTFLRLGYFNSGKYGQVKKIIERQLSIIGNDPKYQGQKYEILSQSAYFSSEHRDYKAAYNTLKSIKQGMKQTAIIFDYYNFLNLLSEACINLKKYNEAKVYLDEVLENTTDKQFRMLRVVSFSLLRIVYEGEKEFQKALIYADSAVTIQNTMSRTENVEKLNELEVTYKTKEIKNQNAFLGKENEIIKSRQMIMISALLVVGLLTLLLLFVLYFLNKSKTKVQSQSDEIHKLSQIRDQYIKIIAHDLRS
jgi:tetratricopeptide (TPR) repeat protein